MEEVQEAIGLARDGLESCGRQCPADALCTDGLTKPLANMLDFASVGELDTGDLQVGISGGDWVWPLNTSEAGDQNAWLSFGGRRFRKKKNDMH